MANKKLTQDKALEILSDGKVHGKRLTRKQKKFFGAIAGGAEPRKAQLGNMITGTTNALRAAYDVVSGIRNLGTEDYSDKGDFNSAYSAAKKAGEEEFVWNGRRYNTKYAGTPRQEVGTYGVKGVPMRSVDMNNPSRINLYPMFGKYLPGHIEASTGDGEGYATVNYSSAGNNPFTGFINPKKGEKAYYSYGVDQDKFYNKATSLPSGLYSWMLDSDDKRPSDWELFTNNCADNVCDAFGVPRSRGLQTPSGALEKIKKAYPTLDVTGRTRDAYKAFVKDSKKKAFDKVEGSREVLSNTDKLLNIYYSPDSDSDLKSDAAWAIQRSLEQQGYKLPKYGPDGIIGNETLEVLKQWKSKNKKQNGGAIEGTMGGLTDKGFNFNPAWGGAWRDGGWLDKYADGGNLQPPMSGAVQPALSQSFAMGGSLPGSVGFMYARTAGAAPSNGPYAKKTKASAQNGAEMAFYQQGLDWRPKTISKNGKSMKKAQVGTKTQIMGDLLSNHNLKSREQLMRESDIRKEAAQANTSQQPYAWMDKQSFVGPSNITESTRITNRANAADARAYDAISNSALSQTMQLATPGGKNPMAGMIGASTLVDMNPITGPITAAGRLTQHGLGYNPYGFGESGFDNFIGGVSVVGDILGTRASYKLLPGSVRPRPSVREEGGDVPKGQNGLTENEKNKILKYLGKDKQKGLSQAELNKIVSKDPKRLQALNTPEAVKENRKRIAEERKRQEQEREKADLTRRFIENQGTISVPGPPQSALSRAWEIATNPVEAFGYAVRNERLPQNFSKARTKTTALDDLTYMINPLSIVDAVINTGGSLYDTGESIYEGDLPGAAMNLFSTSLNALGSLPAIGGAMSLKNVAKPVVKGFKSTWKATPDLPAMTRFKNALNAGSLELNYPGDIHGHSYFNMTPAETVGKMNEELRELGVGAFTMDKSMSNNSAPLFWKKAASLADKDITLIRPGSEQFVNRYGVLGRRVASAIPEEAADMYPSIVKDYEDQIANLLQSGVPSMIARGQQMQKEGLGRHILDQIKQQDTPSARTYYNQFLKNYKPVLDEGIIEVNQRTGLNFPMTRIESAGGYDSHIMPTVIAVKGNPLTRITEALSAPWKDYYLGPRMLDPTLGRGTKRLRTSMYYGDENLGAISQKLIPGVATTQVLGEMSPTTIKQKDGGVVKDNRGYWNPDNWGKVVEIDSNDITMKGVNQPLIGVSDEGDVKYMEPGKDYKFKGKKVKEYPVGAQGVSVNKADEYPLEKLDNLLNFTNYNKPKAKNGWLEKYK
jgi:hypothetical protein